MIQQGTEFWDIFGKALINKKAIEGIVNILWPMFDTKGIGAVTKKQAQEFTQKALETLKLSSVWDESEFDKYFAEADSDNDGALEKHELVDLIEKYANKN